MVKMTSAPTPLETKALERQNLVTFQSEEEAILWLVAKFYALAKETLSKQAHFTCALSGGSTPKKLYSSLLTSPLCNSIDWKRVLIFWSDERAVPPHHPDSNWAMAMQFFDIPPLSFSQKFRMEADANDIDLAAMRYEELIKTLCTDGKFDLILLGIGDDGHTASLFPDTDILQSTHLVEAAFVPAKNAWRMTLTFECINSARNIIVLAFGSSKASILRKVLIPKEDEASYYPAQNIGTKQNLALFVIDSLSARELHSMP
jgi:6-phosphogluconolactonase